MAWSLYTGSLSSSTTASVSTTFSTSVFRRYSWYCPTTGSYKWSSLLTGGSGSSYDLFGWVATKSDAYNTSSTYNPMSGTVLQSDDDTNGNLQFSCTFNATAGTTYYLYASPLSADRNPTGYTFTLTVEPAPPLWSVYGYSLSSSTSVSVTRTYTAGQIYRYSWYCPTTGLYKWSCSNAGITAVGWVATTNSAYNLYTSTYPYQSYLQASSGNEFSCMFNATAGTTYYLYSSGYSNTTSTTTTQTQTLQYCYWQHYYHGDFLSNGLSFTTSLTGQIIRSFSFIPPASGTYTFESSGCTYDSVGWISDKSNAYNLTQSGNSMGQGLWSNDDGNGNRQFKVTATLEGGKTYYLYFSPISTTTLAYNVSTNITLSIKATSIVSTGKLITSSQIQSFKNIWSSLCSSRKYYGNLNNSTAKNAFSVPGKGTKATSTQMNSLINAYNKYFTPAITTVNTGNLIQETNYDTLVTRVMSNPSCKTACTGFCSTTNSHAPMPATCSSCDTGCSSSCYGKCQSSCYGYCYESCDGSCDYGCIYDCGGNCNSYCSGYEGSPPSRDCGYYCDTACGSSCGGGCVYDCWSCDDTCAGTCDDNCDLGCTYDCSGDCEYHCDSTCSATCAGNTAGQAGACNNSCTHACSTSCNTLCVATSTAPTEL